MEVSKFLEKIYKVFQKKTELLFSLIYCPYLKTSADGGIPLKVVEYLTHEKRFREVVANIKANPSEIVCANDLIKAITETSTHDSKFVRGMKSWKGSFENYLSKLEKIERLLESDSQVTDEDLRQIKEIVINYPKQFSEDGSESLEDKFITTNISNLLAAVLKSYQSQTTLANRVIEKQKEQNTKK